MSHARKKKITVRLGLKKSVVKRIDEIAYRAGMMRHVLIERAIEYVIVHRLNIAEIARDQAIKAFLSAQKNDIDTGTSVRIDPDLYVQVQKLCKLSGLAIKDFVNYATAYYIIYVLKLTTQVSQSEQT